MSGVFRLNTFLAQHPEWTAGALRWLIFQASTRTSSQGVIAGNGLEECGAIFRVGRRVFIDEGKFFEWLKSQGTAREKGSKIGHRDLHGEIACPEQR